MALGAANPGAGFPWLHEKVRRSVSCLCLLKSPISNSQGSTHVSACKHHTTLWVRSIHHVSSLHR